MKTLNYSDPIFNNSLIKFKNETLYFPICIDNGIIHVSDVLISNRIMTLNEFRNKYKLGSHSLIPYNAIFNALTKILNSHLINEGNDDSFYFKHVAVDNLNRKEIVRNIYTTTPTLCSRIWERKLGVTINKQHWLLLHRLKETRLKVLSWKILHNIYPTNILLSKMKIANSENCGNCQTRDSMEHFFFYCTLIKPLWLEIQTDIQLRFGIPIKFTDKMVITGIVQMDGCSKYLLDKINHLIAIGKLTISKYKYGKKRLLLAIYETECNIRNIFS